MQADKLAMKILDKNGNEIATVTAGSMVKGDGNYRPGYVSMSFSFDCAAIWEELLLYFDTKFILTYDGKEIPYSYFDKERSNWLNIAEEEQGSLLTENGASWYKRQCYGVYVPDNKKATAYIYLPYETTPLKQINITSVNGTRYLFSEAELAGLSFNAYTTKYDILLVDENGKYLDTQTCYLGAKQQDKPFTFTDVDTGSWKFAGINYVYQKGYMTGVSTELFKPDTPMTRSQFAMTLYSMNGKPAVTFENVFTDVPGGQWYSEAVLWAYKNSIVSGVGGGLFGTEYKITREQLALMLYKYAKETCGFDVTGEEDILDQFADKDMIDSWAKEALEWAVTNGVMSGDGTNLNPLGEATRAECAAMLKSFHVNVVK